MGHRGLCLSPKFSLHCVAYFSGKYYCLLAALYCNSGSGRGGVWGRDALVSALPWWAECLHLRRDEIRSFLADRGTLSVWPSADRCTAARQPAGCGNAWWSCPLQAAERPLDGSRSLHGATIWLWLLQACVAFQCLITNMRNVYMYFM